MWYLLFPAQKISQEFERLKDLKTAGTKGIAHFPEECHPRLTFLSEEMRPRYVWFYSPHVRIGMQT